MKFEVVFFNIAFLGGLGLGGFGIAGAGGASGLGMWAGEAGAMLFPGDAEGIGDRAVPPACDSGGLASDDRDGFTDIVWETVGRAGLSCSDSEADEDCEVIEAVLPGGAEALSRSIVDDSLIMTGEGGFASIETDTEVSTWGKSAAELLPGSKPIGCS